MTLHFIIIIYDLCLIRIVVWLGKVNLYIRKPIYFFIKIKFELDQVFIGYKLTYEGFFHFDKNKLSIIPTSNVYLISMCYQFFPFSQFHSINNFN